MKIALRSSKEILLKHSGGMRLRDVAEFVKTAHHYGCSVLLRNEEQRLDGKNFVELAHWRFREGTKLILETWGFEARLCAEALTEIFKKGEEQALPLDPRRNF